MTREYHVTNIGWASYKDVAEGVLRYDVIFLGFQMCLDGLDQQIDRYITPNRPVLAVLWP